MVKPRQQGLHNVEVPGEAGRDALVGKLRLCLSKPDLNATHPQLGQLDARALSNMALSNRASAAATGTEGGLEAGEKAMPGQTLVFLALDIREKSQK